MSTTTWALDAAHSEIQFKVKHMMISNVTGWFESFTAEAETENDDFTAAKINFSADTSSVNTRNEARDNHLRSGEFFASEEFPKMSFIATGYEKNGSDNTYSLKGDLTIRDITTGAETVAAPGRDYTAKAIVRGLAPGRSDRKSTRLNSSH